MMLWDGIEHSHFERVTHTLTHTGIVQGGQSSLERTVISGFSLKKG